MFKWNKLMNLRTVLCFVLNLPYEAIHQSYTDQIKKSLYLSVWRGLQKSPHALSWLYLQYFWSGCLLLAGSVFLFFWPMTFIGSSCFSWFQITLVGLISYIPSIVDGWSLFRNDLELVAKHKFKIFTIGPGLWSSCEIGRLFGWNECCINRNQYSFIHCVPAWIVWKWSNLAQTPAHNQTQNT